MEKKGKRSGWLPPKNCGSFFSPASDIQFQTEHPVGYLFVILLGGGMMLASWLLCK